MTASSWRWRIRLTGTWTALRSGALDAQAMSFMILSICLKRRLAICGCERRGYGVLSGCGACFARSFNYDLSGVQSSSFECWMPLLIPSSMNRADLKNDNFEFKI